MKNRLPLLSGSVPFFPTIGCAILFSCSTTCALDYIFDTDSLQITDRVNGFPASLDINGINPSVSREFNGTAFWTFEGDVVLKPGDNIFIRGATPASIYIEGNFFLPEGASISASSSNTEIGGGGGRGGTTQASPLGESGSAGGAGGGGGAGSDNSSGDSGGPGGGSDRFGAPG